MRRLAHYLIAGTAALIVSPSYAECTYPDSIDIPDGTTASTEEMINGQKTVKAFMAEMEAYLQCLDKDAAALGEAATDEQKGLHIQRHNAAVDAMEATAARFNEQVRAYKAAKR